MEALSFSFAIFKDVGDL